MAEGPASILLKAGVLSHWREEKALTFAIPSGTSRLNSLFGPNICPQPSPLPSYLREEGPRE